jgi:hypothetical protein
MAADYKKHTVKNGNTASYFTAKSSTLTDVSGE